MKHILFLFSFICLSAITFANPPADTPVFVKEFLGQVDFVKNRLVQLAEAMPEDKYSYTPAEGVRTVGEVFVHTAQANYYFMNLITGKKSESDRGKSENDKNTSIAMLNKSFDWLKDEASKLTEADLNKEIEAFGMKFTVRNFMVTLLNHAHEHLGQSIAYARMNGVTPPWSAQE